MSAPEDRLSLVDADDQTGSDSDQTSSDVDQTLSDRDQDASDRDQASANADQRAADEQVAAGGDLAAHEKTTLARAQATADRDEVSQLRDEVALDRLSVAEARDRAAEARDQAAEQADRESELADRALGEDVRAVEVLTRAARIRERAAADRANAAADRERAAADRVAAARERANAETDELTGAWTRKFGLAAIAREVARAHRTGGRLMLAFLDVDRLKELNDGFGHPAGDRVLEQLGETVRAHTRPYDILVRVGGDEFLCAMPNLARTAARERLNTIAAALQAASARSSTVSIGFADLAPDDDLERLIARADADLLAARRNRPRRNVSLG